MKIKVIKECWYNNRYIDPDVAKEEVIIDFDGDKLPSWGVKATLDEINNAVAKDETEETETTVEIVEDTNTKVKELPLTEKNALLEEANKVGIRGNQLLSFKVSTLKNKIAIAKQEKGE